MALKGIITAMITPMDEQQNIQEAATRQLIDRLIDKGVHGLFILGTNGEFHVLSDDEKVSYAKLVIDHVGGRVPVYVGTGGCGTLETIRLSKRMEALKPDALSVITPFLVKLSQEELMLHYKHIADAVSVPVIMYNIPANTGMNLEKETVAALASHPNIIGIKDSSGNVETIKGYLEAAETLDFSVLIGSDSKILTGLELGADGAVASTSNAITEHIVSIYDHFNAGNLEAAKQAQEAVDVLRAVLKLGSVPSVIKRAVTLLGIEAGNPRFPVKPLDTEHDSAVRKALEHYGL